VRYKGMHDKIFSIVLDVIFFLILGFVLALFFGAVIQNLVVTIITASVASLVVVLMSRHTFNYWAKRIDEYNGENKK